MKRTIQWLVIGLMLLASGISFALEDIRIGILAFRPKPQTQAQWAPLADALSKTFPEHRFTVKALGFEEMSSAVASRQVDFILTNPGHYVLMASHSGLSAPLATLVNLEQGSPVSAYGGVIFSRKEQASIHHLQDVRGKSVAVTSTDSLGGYQLQAYEFSQAGLNLPKDARLLPVGMPHDKVVEAVLRGEADIGLIRSGLLERLAAEGKLDMAKLTIVNRQELPGFPVAVSTRLYPEWLLAATPHTDKDLGRKVVSFLLNIEENPTLTSALGIHGFDVPSDYTPVTSMLAQLRMPPFDRTPAFSAADVWRRYRWQVMLGIAATVCLLALGVSLLLVNRRLRIEKDRVQQQSANLEASEQKLTSILDGVDACIYLKDTQGRYLFANRAVRQLWQSEMDDIIGFGDEKFFDAATAANIRINDRRVLENGETLKAEEVNTVDGTQKSVTYQSTKMPLRRPDGSIYALCGISTDISEIRQTQEALQASLKEKVALLNEVHHRVKNNLQVITSLLRLEARRSNQPDTKTVLTEMQGRIRSMALLHESLYRSGIFASVELGTYLRQLATQAFRAQSSINGSIQLQLDLNPVQVSMDQATPCGLLVNELISNCLKHGFPDNRQGEVRIALQTLAGTTGDATRVRLCVSDTGIGLSADFESRRGNSLGLQLVSDLTQQLGGCLEIGPGPGAAFTVTFTVAEPA